MGIDYLTKVLKELCIKVTNILYLSYDGMTDPLGQSQVIPYLIGLSERGYRFHLISFEKKNLFSKNKEIIDQKLRKHNIIWHPFIYTKNPPVISTLWDIYRMRRKVKTLLKTKEISIVHCRSYIPALVGLWMKKKFEVKFIFDMRGFWADERVDGNLWNLNNPFYKIIYRFFKNEEKKLLSNADYTVCLTENAVKEIRTWKEVEQCTIPIKVIPCCVDLKLFAPEKIGQRLQNDCRERLKINSDDFIVSYLGTIGTWYMLDEMLMFFKQLLKAKPHAKFLFVTHEDPKIINQKSKALNIPDEKIIITQSSRNDVPAFLSLSNISLFFIKPAYSKIASSPTKLAEIMAMGIPVICNSEVGDVEKIINEAKAGVTIELKGNLNMEFGNAIRTIDNLIKSDKKSIRQYVTTNFSLEKGIELYEKIYSELALSDYKLNDKPKNILVLTSWSYKDALIQTYTLPYLKIIKNILPKESKLFLVTAEHWQYKVIKKKKKQIISELSEENIIWKDFKFRQFGWIAILAGLFDLVRLSLLCKRQNITHIHTWCTPAGASGYLLSKITNIPLIIDSYEPHAESMVQNGTWKKKGLAFKILFYFERKMSVHASHVIAVTEGMRSYSKEKYAVEIKNFYVKPACVDLNLFSISMKKNQNLLKEFNFENKIVGVYAGKMGGIYLEKEIFDFFKAAYNFWGDKFRVLLLTNTSIEKIKSAAAKSDLPEIFTVRYIPHENIPSYLGLADFALNPVKPVPAKRYCTSIKDGEYWAMGLPVVITSDISNDSEIIEKNQIGAVIQELNYSSYMKAVRDIDKLIQTKISLDLETRIRSIAHYYRNYLIAEKVYRQIYG